MKIKVCDRCGAVRTKKNCTKCVQKDELILHSAILMAQAAQEAPGIVAAAIQELKDNLDPEVLYGGLGDMADEVIADLRKKALQNMM